MPPFAWSPQVVSTGAAGRAFQATTAYKAGDVISQAGSLYAAKVDFTSGASFSAADWNDLLMSSKVPWKRIRTGHLQVGSAAGALTTGLHEAGANSPGGTGGALGAFYFDPADHASGGLTCKLRIRIEVLTNDVAPAITFTVSLKPVSATGGAAGSTTATLGSDVSGSSVAIVTPGADNGGAHNEVEFTAPAAGFYDLTLVTSGTTAASSTTTVRGSLHARAI